MKQNIFTAKEKQAFFDHQIKTTFKLWKFWYINSREYTFYFHEVTRILDIFDYDHKNGEYFKDTDITPWIDVVFEFAPDDREEYDLVDELSVAITDQDNNIFWVNKIHKEKFNSYLQCQTNDNLEYD